MDRRLAHKEKKNCEESWMKNRECKQAGVKIKNIIKDSETTIRTHTPPADLPDLVLQEVHVAVKQSVGRRQNSHRLHPRSSLQLALNRHVGKTGQPEVIAFTEISNQRQSNKS